MPTAPINLRTLLAPTLLGLAMFASSANAAAPAT